MLITPQVKSCDGGLSTPSLVAIVVVCGVLGLLALAVLAYFLIKRFAPGLAVRYAFWRSFSKSCVVCLVCLVCLVVSMC